MASGNVVHNLPQATFESHLYEHPWALAFEKTCISVLEGKIDRKEMMSAELLRFAAPTPEHLLPFFFAMGLAFPEEKAKIIYQGIQNSTFSMLSF